MPPISDPIARFCFRLRFAALLVAALLLAGCATIEKAGALVTNRIAFDADDVQAYLDRQYPRDYKQLGGLASLRVLNPRVAIPESDNRLHLDFDVGIEGLGMRGEKPVGHFAVTSGLRYDSTGQALYLEEPTLESAELPLLGGRMNATGRDLINSWLRDYARAEPVYALDAEHLKSLGSRRVAGTLIENGKIVIKLDR
jgi:Protein of unknown function (DUF1439)